jgi:hypothetical protein
VNHARPDLKRKPMQAELRPNPCIKLVKDNVNHYHVGIWTIDSGRIDEIGPDSP